MRDQYLYRKIRSLSNAKLLEVVKLGDAAKGEIFAVAEEEAKLRKLEYRDYRGRVLETDILEKEFLTSLTDFKEFNWGACFLCVYWCLAHKMDYWVILLLIPIVNIAVMLYLGFNGNKLAFEKSDFKSKDDFLKVQSEWSKWGYRVFWLLVVVIIFRVIFFEMKY